MRRPSPALVVAVIALIVAMSGTSYAVTQLPRNSVGAKQLKKNAVTVQKIASNAVTGAKVKDGSLTAADFAAGTLLQGPKGDQGATGATGPTGPSTSAAAWHIPTPFTMTGPFQEVISLGASPTGDNDSTGTITVSVPSNLVMMADLNFEAVTSATSTEYVIVGCLIQLREVPLGGWVSPAYSYLTQVTLTQSYDSSIAPVGLATVEAGTYDVRAVCRDYGGNGFTTARFVGGALTVVATGR